MIRLILLAIVSLIVGAALSILHETETRQPAPATSPTPSPTPPQSPHACNPPECQIIGG